MNFEIGLLGAGFIAEFHVRAVARIPGVKIRWVCDADLARAEALASTIPGAKAVGSIEALLAEKPDVVHVLLPPGAHATAATAALSAGAHVLLEKPFATSSQDVRVIAAAATSAGRRVGVNHNLCFNPSFRELVSAIRAKKLGALEHVQITWNVPLRQLSAAQFGHWMFRAPQNILLEQGVHPLSMIHFLLGGLRRASVLPAATRTLPSGSEFHETWVIGVELERGTAQLLLSFGREFSEIVVHAIGQDGTATADLKRNSVVVRENTVHEPPLDDLFAGLDEAASRAGQAGAHFADTLLGMVKMKPPYDPFGQSIADSVAAFYAALAEGREPAMGANEGAAVIAMCEAIALAASEGPSHSLENAV